MSIHPPLVEVALIKPLTGFFTMPIFVPDVEPRSPSKALLDHSALDPLALVDFITPLYSSTNGWPPLKLCFILLFRQFIFKLLLLIKDICKFLTQTKLSPIVVFHLCDRAFLLLTGFRNKFDLFVFQDAFQT
jgi:hypothetical protein